MIPEIVIQWQPEVFKVFLMNLPAFSGMEMESNCAETNPNTKSGSETVITLTEPEHSTKKIKINKNQRKTTSEPKKNAVQKRKSPAHKCNRSRILERHETHTQRTENWNQRLHKPKKGSRSIPRNNLALPKTKEGRKVRRRRRKKTS